MTQLPACIEPEISKGELDRPSLHSFIATLDANDLTNRRRVRAVNERCIAQELRRCGVSRASLDFSGGGDSGEFGEPLFLDDAGKVLDLDMPNAFLVGINREFCFERRDWKMQFELRELPLDEAINNHVEAIVDEAGCNWYDQDGGSGDWFMDLATGETALDINVNVIESYNEHSDNHGIGELSDDVAAPPEVPGKDTPALAAD